MENSKEILTEQIKIIFEKIKRLSQEREDLRNVLKTMSGFEVGEKVKVIQVNWKGEDFDESAGFISLIGVHNNGEFYYHVNKSKKDGTEAKISFSKYDKFRVEKLK